MPSTQDSPSPDLCVAHVVTDLSLDREFDYRIPERLLGRIQTGSRVRVPFGRGKDLRTGYVVGLSAASEYPRLKEIESLEQGDKHIPPKLIALARWIADYYCCTREQAVRTLLPAAVRKGKVKPRQLTFVGLVPDVHLAEETEALGKRAPRQVAVLEALVRLGTCTSVRLERETGVDAGVLRRLEQKGLIFLEKRDVPRDPLADDIILPTKPQTLTAEQKVVVDAVNAAVDRRRPEVILLHGVTGSGKTEVYMQAIAHCLDAGRDAIVLVPEISLTPQTTERFRSRFGDRISVLHSGLSDGERFDEWMKISDGRARIAVGARSALFAPFRNLGLIVVDEEHETTYKQSEAPRYQARDVSVVRGRMENAVVVLGSATPSLESYYNCEVGKYALAELTTRIDDRRMPAMEVVDMRAEAMTQGGSRIFSRRLEELVRDRLERGEQVILFLNRRGFATQMMCTKCGYVATCDHCSTTYTYHRRQAQLVCHLCGTFLTAPERCPKCQDPEIRYSGLGTERIEDITAKVFPKAVVARMDSDTMTRKDAYRKTLLAFRSGRIQILIGTQMIAKGLDFPNVTLVGIIYADLGLHIPDFRSGERTFQLLTQVAGRAGRGEQPGYVVVQTYTPFHPALECACDQDFKAFYEYEMPSREELGFPPFTHMALVHFRGENESAVAECALAFAARLRPHLSDDMHLGDPVPSPLAKVRGQFRYQLSVRCTRVRRLSAVLRHLVVVQGSGDKTVEAYVDMDPYSLF